MNESNETTPQELYGEGAVLGNESDVVVQNNVSSEQIELPTPDEESLLNTEQKDEPKEEPKASNEEPPAEEPKSTEGELQDQVSKSNETLKAVSDDLKTKGVDFNKIINEYDTNGNLSDATREALRKAGYPDAVVDGFISSRQVVSERYTEQVYSYAGGEDNYRQLMSWASNNLSSQEVDTFNKAIDDGNLTVVKLMMDGIQAKRTAKFGTRKPSIVGGASSTSSSLKGYTSRDEIVKAMSDPRYERDARYRGEVERRMMLTTIL